MPAGSSSSRPSGRPSGRGNSSGSSRPSGGARSGAGRPSSGGSGRPSSGRPARDGDSRGAGRPSSGRPARDGDSRGFRDRDDRAGSGRPSSGRPARDGDSRSFRDRDDRAGSSRPSSGRPSSGRPARDGDSRGAGRPSSGRPSSGRPSRDGDSRSFRDRDDRAGSGRPRRDDARPSRDGDSRGSGRPSSGRPSTGRPSRDGDSRGFRDRDDRGGAGRPRRDDARPSRDGDSRGAGRPSSGRPSSGRPSTGRPSRDGDSRSFRDRDDRAGSGRPRRDDARPFRGRDDRDDRAPRSRRPSGDAPIIADHITGEELPRAVRNELRTLPDGLALRVARHMAACVELANVDPELAWLHAKAALDKASRIAVVRETAAGAAYHAGHFAEALSEYRAAKRMTGNKEYWPVMADCERALGRPGKAISMASDPIVAGLLIGGRVEMRIVVSGARLDQGNKEAALATLQCPELNKPATEPWAARIRYAYADILASMGQTQEAIEWFHRAAAVDLEEQTDSDRRIAELEGNVYEEFDNDYVYEEYAAEEDE